MLHPEGILLHKYPFSENSLICKVLTAEHGLITLVAKGAKRPKSALGARLQTSMKAEWTYKMSPHSEMWTLRQVNPLESFPNTTESPLLAAQLAFLQEILLRTLPSLVEQRESYDLLLSTLEWVEKAKPSSEKLLRMSIRFLAFHAENLGFGIQWNYCGQCEKELEGQSVAFVPENGVFVCSCSTSPTLKDTALWQMLSLGRCDTNYLSALESMLLHYLQTHWGERFLVRSYDVLTGLRSWKL